MLMAFLSAFHTFFTYTIASLKYLTDCSDMIQYPLHNSEPLAISPYSIPSRLLLVDNI